MSYYSKRLKTILEVLNQNIYPPVYNEKKWKFIRYVNCYSYVLDIPVSDPKQQIWIPGNIYNENSPKHIFSENELLDGVYNDLETLNFLFREDNGKLNDMEYRIALYRFPTFYDYPISFHFSRQDNTGIWSEKSSWDSKICQLDNCTDEPDSMKQYNASLIKTLVLKRK